MKKLGFKLIKFIEKLFNIKYCFIYNRSFDYRKTTKGGDNGFKDKNFCPFCNIDKVIEKGNLIKENNFTYIINNLNPYPNTKKHILITPKRHIRTWKELTNEELFEIQENIDKYLDKDYILLGRQYIGENSVSGASVHHLHIHLILKNG